MQYPGQYPQQPYPGQYPPQQGGYPGQAGYGAPPSAGFMAGVPAPAYGAPSYGAGFAEAGGDNYGDNMGAFSSKEVRMGFIRKVYSILSVQLLITTGFIMIFAFHDDTKIWARRQGIWLMILAFVASIVSLCTLACCGSVRRAFPQNFICLGIFTLAQSVVLGFASAFSKSDAVWMAVLITAVVVISLTIFAFQTKIDFTACAGVAFVGLVILMIFGLVLAFVKIPILHLIYACIGALLFSFYLIIDTQMIVGGNHKSQISPEEYIFGVITLYTDIINIFMYILQILNYANSD
jgi:hypothetical protein